MVSRLDDHRGNGDDSWLIPRGAVTGVGSLPTSDPAQAIEFVAAHAPLLPFCPQPPPSDLVSDTLDQQLDSASLETERWLQPFVDAALGGAFPRALALKSQLTGPLTLAGLVRAAGRTDLGSELLVRLADHVGRRAVEQHHKLRVVGLPVLIVVDEPALVLADPLHPRPKQLLEGILDRIRKSGARTGIHCCATTEPRTFGTFDCDVISFDISQDLLPDEDDVTVLRDERRTVAFGLIGSTPPSGHPGLAISRWLTAASMAGDVPSLAARTIVTTRCGLGRSTLAEAEIAFEAASTTSALVARCARDPHDVDRHDHIKNRRAIV
jgi:hypothetical protein